ncbi:MAG: hypothetical protein ACE5IW_10520, partial [bacterium]
TMNARRYLFASLGVFVVYFVLSIIVHWVLLKGAYEATADVWRPQTEMNAYMPILWVTQLVVSFLFVFIYTKGYEGKGIMEGVRYGLWIGLLMSIPMAFGSYASLPIPLGLAIRWLVFGLVEFIILGIVAAAIYKPAAQPAAA